MEGIHFGRWCCLGVGRQQANSNKEQGGGWWHPTGTSICKEILPHPNLLSSCRCISVSLEYYCHIILVPSCKSPSCLMSFVSCDQVCEICECIQNDLSRIPKWYWLICFFECSECCQLCRTQQHHYIRNWMYWFIVVNIKESCWLKAKLHSIVTSYMFWCQFVSSCACLSFHQFGIFVQLNGFDMLKQSV